MAESEYIPGFPYEEPKPVSVGQRYIVALSDERQYGLPLDPCVSRMVHMETGEERPCICAYRSPKSAQVVADAAPDKGCVVLAVSTDELVRMSNVYIVAVTLVEPGDVVNMRGEERPLP